jgi:hypothetical protein
MADTRAAAKPEVKVAAAAVKKLMKKPGRLLPIPLEEIF